MALTKDFKEFIELLNKHNVRYLVVGGYAVAMHGHPHYTKDLDVWVDPTRDNAKKILRVLKDFGFESLELKEEDFTSGEVVQFGNPPNRIDVLSELTALNFSDCFNTKQIIEYEGVSILVIDLDHLKKNKQAVGRPQDIADLDRLKKKD